MEEKRANWEPGIEDLAYIAHVWMHHEFMDKPCHLCARYPLPKDIEADVQYDNKGFQDAEVVEGSF